MVTDVTYSDAGVTVHPNNGDCAQDGLFLVSWIMAFDEPWMSE
jgi:hypothetical protein